MASIATDLVEISYPDVVGWEWEVAYEDFEGEGIDSGIYYHQITWIRGTDTLQYGTKAPTNPSGQWVNAPIVNPERFGFDGTLAGARTAARAFYEKAEIK